MNQRPFANGSFTIRPRIFGVVRMSKSKIKNPKNMTFSQTGIPNCRIELDKANSKIE
jgi:hypothetical protein